MITRRKFVKTISAGVAASLVLPQKLLALPPKNLIGIQLYTLHNQMKENALDTLEKVAT